MSYFKQTKYVFFTSSDWEKEGKKHDSQEPFKRSKSGNKVVYVFCRLAIIRQNDIRKIFEKLALKLSLLLDGYTKTKCPANSFGGPNLGYYI